MLARHEGVGGMDVTGRAVAGRAVTCMIVGRVMGSMAMRRVATGASTRGGRPGCVLFDHWLLLAFGNLPHGCPPSGGF